MVGLPLRYHPLWAAPNYGKGRLWAVLGGTGGIGSLVRKVLSGRNVNKTGLQPISRPVEQFLGVFQKGMKKGSISKSLKRRKNIAKMPQNLSFRRHGA